MRTEPDGRVMERRLIAAPALEVIDANRRHTAKRPLVKSLAELSIPRRMEHPRLRHFVQDLRDASTDILVLLSTQRPAKGRNGGF